MQLLTPDEKDCIKLAGELWNLLCKVVQPGPTAEGDTTELIHHIHAIQHTVMAQAAARAFPDRYRLLGSVINDE